MTTNFLGNYYAGKDEPITHTRIGNKNLKIHGGTYSIPTDQYDTFLQLYFYDVFKNNNLEYLVERQIDQNGPLIMDIDFHFAAGTTERFVTKKHIDELVKTIVSVLDSMYEFYKPEKTFQIFIFQKPHVNMEEHRTKDGIYVLIGIQRGGFIDQIYLRDEMVKKADEKKLFMDLPIIDDWNETFDFKVSSGSCCLQLIG